MTHAEKASQYAHAAAVLQLLADEHPDCKNAILASLGMDDDDYEKIIDRLNRQMEVETERELNTPQARAFFLSQVPGEIDMSGPHED